MNYYNRNYIWNYESKNREEEEIHRRDRTYDKLIFRRGSISQHRGIIEDEKRSKEAQENRK
jgi:hypothetical protein